MTIKEYIQSGILEDYTLGLLSLDDQIKVEAMSKEHTAVACALQKIRLDLDKYAGTAHISRRGLLRKSIWQAVKKIWSKNLD